MTSIKAEGPPVYLLQTHQIRVHIIGDSPIVCVQSGSPKHGGDQGDISPTVTGIKTLISHKIIPVERVQIVAKPFLKLHDNLTQLLTFLFFKSILPNVPHYDC